jgi:hypothetical protein
MEPHLLLLVFLPIIGFSAAIAQEPHMLRKSWVQVGVSCHAVDFLGWTGSPARPELQLKSTACRQQMGLDREGCHQHALREQQGPPPD